MTKATVDRLYLVGWKAMQDPYALPENQEGCHPLLYGIAAMLAEAVKPTQRRKSREEGTKGPTVNPQTFLELLREHSNGKVICDGIDPATFGAVGSKFVQVGVVLEDVDRFMSWVQAGGLNWVKQPFTWNDICRPPTFRLVDWIIRARAAATPAKQLEFDFDKVR